MVTYNKFNAFVEYLSAKEVDLFGNPIPDTLKVMLTNVAPVATNSVKGDLTEISAGGGYSAGGITAPDVKGIRSSGTLTLSADTVSLTASGDVGPFRYAVLYDDTATNDPLIAWWDYGSSITLHSGDSLDINFNSDPTDGTVFTLT